MLYVIPERFLFHLFSFPPDKWREISPVIPHNPFISFVISAYLLQLWLPPSLLFSWYRVSFPGVIPTHAEVKNEWSYTSPPPIYLHGLYNIDSIVKYITNENSRHLSSRPHCFTCRKVTNCTVTVRLSTRSHNYEPADTVPHSAAVSICLSSTRRINFCCLRMSDVWSNLICPPIPAMVSVLSPTVTRRRDVPNLVRRMWGCVPSCLTSCGPYCEYTAVSERDEISATRWCILAYQ